ncbi:hypothetical protein ACIBEA_43615 [Streptomyces sp. NPDC051555]|uniref:hypothetical protein n=1 Tax=Streptomyces sp. NPDC051555 TaxID=3365657 RepID=UPI003797BB60
MSKDEIIASVTERLRETPTGDLFRCSTAWFMAPVAEDDLPAKPEARYDSALTPEGHEGHRSGETDPAAWARLNELRDRLKAEAHIVTRNLVETLRAWYPSADALEMYENEDGWLLTVRLVSADGRTVRDLRNDVGLPTDLPELPEPVRALWPKRMLQEVEDLDELLTVLAKAGVGFDDLPDELRDNNDCPDLYIPALLLGTACELGC